MSSSLHLFRALLRSAHSMSDYNVSAYCLRRVRTDFRANRNLESTEAATKLLWGKEQLEIMQRQAVITKMFPGGKNVMEAVLKM